MEGANEAEAVTRIVLDGMLYTLKIVGPVAGKLLQAILDQAAESYDDFKLKQNMGEISLKDMIKSGKELRCFTLRGEQLNKFRNEAKRFGLNYTIVKSSPEDKENDTYEILCKAEDASRINRILERIGALDLQHEIPEEGEQTTEGSKDDLAHVRDLVSRMFEPDERNPDMAADANQSAAFYQQQSDRRPSVKSELDSINENIDAYQPERKSSAAEELISQMLSAAAAERDTPASGTGADNERDYMPGGKQDVKTYAAAGEKDVKGPDLSSDNNSKTPLSKGQHPHVKSDELERLKRELGEAYDRIMDNMNHTSGK